MKLHLQTLILLACLAVPAGAAKQPNVVVFLTDDQGYGDLGYHGNTHLKTPQLDAFAREAVELTRFHVSPVCAPTRASLMTGRYNFRGGVADVFGAACKLDPAEVTLAEALQAGGYATGLFGKWHLGDDPENSPNAQGFEESLTFKGPAMRANQYFNPDLFHNGVKKSYPGYCLDIFTDAAIRFINKNRTNPFFLYLPSNLIHTPMVVDPALAETYVAFGPSTSKIYGMMTSVDNNFGRLRQALKTAGVEDDTLIIFTADNGPCSGSVPTNRFMAGLHGLKGTVYENGIRVPCFARWPAGFKSPGKLDRLTAHIDVMPTVLEACGIPQPSKVKFDGTSFLSLLRNPQTDWAERTLFFQWDSGQIPRRGHAFAVLTERYKLVQPVGMDAANQLHIRQRYAELCQLQGRGVRSIEGSPRYELYEITSDPGENNDVAAQHPEVVEQMKRQYDTWFTDVCARWLK